MLPDAKPWDYVLVRLAIDFRRELRIEDERVVVSCGVDRIGRSSITLREEIRTTSGEIAAESETVVRCPGCRDRTSPSADRGGAVGSRAGSRPVTL